MRGVTALVMVLGLGVSLASALDAPILGKQLLIKDPKPSVDASKRSFTQIVTGGVCAADGSCSEQPIAPLQVCCQGAGACEDATVTNTGALYDFHAACQGPQTGTTTLGAVCAPSGSCAQG